MKPNTPHASPTHDHPNAPDPPTPTPSGQKLETLGITCLLLACIALTPILPQSVVWLTPAAILLAATVPTILHRQPLARLGLQLSQPSATLCLTAVATLLLLLTLTIALYLLRLTPWTPPWPLAWPQHGLPAWIAWQLLAVAIPEELFFRGFLLDRLTRITDPNAPTPPPSRLAAASALSAAAFALAHFLATHAPASLLTFFPALLFAWAFLRTRSLLTPICLHVAANLAYAGLPILLAQFSVR